MLWEKIQYTSGICFYLANLKTIITRHNSYGTCINNTTSFGSIGIFLIPTGEANRNVVSNSLTGWSYL